jgi:hypothetical protein
MALVLMALVLMALVLMALVLMALVQTIFIYTHVDLILPDCIITPSVFSATEADIHFRPAQGEVLRAC